MQQIDFFISQFDLFGAIFFGKSWVVGLFYFIPIYALEFCGFKKEL